MDEPKEEEKPYISSRFMEQPANVQRWLIYKLLLKMFMFLKALSV